jgi:hypothetical protein
MAKIPLPALLDKHTACDIGLFKLYFGFGTVGLEEAPPKPLPGRLPSFRVPNMVDARLQGQPEITLEGRFICWLLVDGFLVNVFLPESFQLFFSIAAAAACL